MDVFTGPDALTIHLTGADAAGDAQLDHALSLGKYYSSARATTLRAMRTNPIPGLRVEHVSGNLEGAGLCTVAAVDADTLSFATPDDGVGDSVAIAVGERKVIQAGDANRYVIVLRGGSQQLIGSETLQFLPTYNNVIGGSDFTDAERAAGESKYRAIMLRNSSALALSDVAVWLDADEDDGTRIAVETGVDGLIQEIADELTAPTGVSWNTGTTSGTGLVIGTMNPGGTRGVWIERSVAMGGDGSAYVPTRLHYQFTYDGTVYTGELSGLSRIEETALARVELHHAVGAVPDFVTPAEVW